MIPGPWVARWNFARRRELCSAPECRQGTWLEVRPGPRVGCLICEAAKTGSPWAQFGIASWGAWRPHKIARHENSRLHRLARTKSLDGPSDQEFNEVLDDFRGKTGSKRHAVKWCLDEGLRQVQWQMLSKDNGGANTIALSQDGRNNRLLLRLAMSSEKYQKESITLGQVQCLGTDAHSVARTTAKVIKDFSTPGANLLPYGNLRLEPAVVAEPVATILTIIKSKTEALVTDAASDEMKAGRLLSGEDHSKHAARMFKNLKHHSQHLSFFIGAQAGMHACMHARMHAGRQAGRQACIINNKI